jgi:hypothetical protein
MEMVRAEDHVESGFLGRHRLLHQIFRLVGLVTAQPGKFHAITRTSSGLVLAFST